MNMVLGSLVTLLLSGGMNTGLGGVDHGRMVYAPVSEGQELAVNAAMDEHAHLKAMLLVLAQDIPAVEDADWKQARTAVDIQKALQQAI